MVRYGAARVDRKPKQSIMSEYIRIIGWLY